MASQSERKEKLYVYTSDQNQTDELVFFNVYGIFLHWTKQSSFSYLSTPRPNHALMYILCDRVRIEYPDGTVEIFQKGSVIYIPKGLRYSVKFSGNTEHLEALLINFSIGGAVPPCRKVIRLVDDAVASDTDAFYTIISLYTQAQNCRYAVMGKFYHLLDRISAHMESKIPATSAYRSILPAIDYIDSHIMRDCLFPPLQSAVC